MQYGYDRFAAWFRDLENAAPAPARPAGLVIPGRDGAVESLGLALEDAVARAPANARAILLAGYFPNVVEHAAICAAASRKGLASVVFRRASSTHGQFLSERDHGRLADYESLGLEVSWCNDHSHTIDSHVYFGFRGFFASPATAAALTSSTVIAIYGSAEPLDAADLRRFEDLLARLHALIQSPLAVITGGGPGAMRQISDLAGRLGFLVGAIHLETESQRLNKDVDFFQTFRARSRHSRARWFEVANLHLFCPGGFGTMEEAGMVLTDMKLGIAKPSPVVFFGGHDRDPYWSHFGAQIAKVLADARAPGWIADHLLVTSTPGEAIAFYARHLGRLGPADRVASI